MLLQCCTLPETEWGLSMARETEFNEDDFISDTSSGSGDTVMVSIRMKREDAADLQQIINCMGKRTTRSELLRELVMPYITALRYAKEGRNWKGALEFGKGLQRLKKGLTLAAEKEETMDLSQDTVMEVPNQ